MKLDREIFHKLVCQKNGANLYTGSGKIGINDFHQYLCEDIVANHSVTEVIRTSSFCNEDMKIAGIAGNILHRTFAKVLLDKEISQEELRKDSLSIINNLADAFWNFVNRIISDNENIDVHIYIESPLISEFQVNQKHVYIGGTADIVILAIDHKANSYMLHVIDLKTANTDAISSEWREQIAAYIMMYDRYFNLSNLHCKARNGYILSPGKSPRLAVTTDTVRCYYDIFISKLNALYPVTINADVKELLEIYLSETIPLEERIKHLKDEMKYLEDKIKESKQLFSFYMDQKVNKWNSCPHSISIGDYLVIKNKLSTTTRVDTDLVREYYPHLVKTSEPRLTTTLEFNGLKIKL